MATLNTILPAAMYPIFVDNIPNLEFSNISENNGMMFKLHIQDYQGTQTTLLDEIVFGNSQQKAVIKINQVVDTALTHQLPDGNNLFIQNKLFGTLLITYDGNTYSLTVVKGGIDIPKDQFGTYNYTSFFRSNMLSWMPSHRIVKLNETLFLNYMCMDSNAQLIVKSYKINPDKTIAVAEHTPYSAMSVNRFYTYQTNFADLIQKTTITDAVAFEIYVKDTSNIILSNRYRFTFTDVFNEFDDVFSFNNSLGGLDTIRLTGTLKSQQEHESLIALNYDNESIEFDNQYNEVFLKYSGYLDTTAKKNWANEFLSSHFRHHIIKTNSQTLFKQIYITNQTAETTRYSINSFNFEFKYASQKRAKMFQHQPLPPFNPLQQKV